MGDLWQSVKYWLIPRITYFMVVWINSSLRLKVIGEEKLERLGHFNEDQQGPPLLFSSWHRHIWIPIYYLRDRGYIALTSRSRDGEYISRLLHKLGWKTIRGSSTRGGGRSLIKLYKKLLEGESVAITPDGPTGPLYKVKPGIIYLQERCDGYIVPLGIAVARKKLIDSWDKYVLPLPFSRAVLVMGDPVQFSSELSVDKRCRLLEEEMEVVQNRAEEVLANL